MAQWLLLLHPHRENFAATMTEVERECWSRHADRLEALTEEGVVLLAVFEAEDEAAAWAFVNADPTVAEGHVTAELHPFRASFVRRVSA